MLQRHPRAFHLALVGLAAQLPYQLGALEFVVRLTTVDNQHGTRVAEMRSVTVQRNP